MGNLEIFNHPNFGGIRTVEIDGKIYFVGSDIAKALGYSNSRDALSRHCKSVVKHDIPHPQNKDKNLEINIISEGDLYRLILHSKLPKTQEFESWIFDDVLPSIRKHGAYMTPETIESVLLNPDTIIKIATALKEEQEKSKQLEQTIKKQEPKVVFADAVSTSKTTILVGDMAKILRQNGIDTGQKRFFKWLRENGYLIKRKGEEYNMPTQYSMELGLFEIKETTLIHSDGHITINKTPKITGKGQIHFVNKLIKTNFKQSPTLQVVC